MPQPASQRKMFTAQNPPQLIWQAGWLGMVAEVSKDELALILQRGENHMLLLSMLHLL